MTTDRDPYVGCNVPAPELQGLDSLIATGYGRAGAIRACIRFTLTHRDLFDAWSRVPMAPCPLCGVVDKMDSPTNHDCLGATLTVDQLKETP